MFDRRQCKPLSTGFYVNQNDRDRPLATDVENVAIDIGTAATSPIHRKLKLEVTDSVRPRP